MDEHAAGDRGRRQQIFQWTGLALSWLRDGHWQTARIRGECPSKDAITPRHDLPRLTGGAFYAVLHGFAAGPRWPQRGRGVAVCAGANETGRPSRVNVSHLRGKIATARAYCRSACRHLHNEIGLVPRFRPAPQAAKPRR